MSNLISIESLNGVLKQWAKICDKNNDNVLSEAELSIFNDGKSKVDTDGNLDSFIPSEEEALEVLCKDNEGIKEHKLREVLDNGEVFETIYDDNGNAIKTIETTIDENGNRTEIENNADGTSSIVSYSNGTIKEVFRGPNGEVTRNSETIYNVNGRDMTLFRDEYDNVTDIIYTTHDDYGNKVEEHTDPNGNRISITSYTYDDNGILREKVYQSSSYICTTTYDANGEVINEVSAATSNKQKRNWTLRG